MSITSIWVLEKTVIKRTYKEQQTTVNIYLLSTK